MNYALINLTKSVHPTQFMVRITLTLASAFMLLLILVSCHSDKGNTVSPQTTPGSGDFFSKCTVSNYQCSGDNSTCSTLLAPNQNGNSDNQFVFGMVVNNNPYQQLTVVITLSSFSGKGIYTLTSANTDVSYVAISANTDTYQSAKVKGTLEVTDYQVKNYIQGKYTINSSQGTRAVDLKDGTFNVKANF